jgi:DNA mismatch endonuclease (patch repair protein)
MQANRSRDTAPEVRFRAALHRLGLRYFKHRRPVPGLRCEADVVFPRIRLAVFLDGCYWHGCAEHGALPAANADWWRAKFERVRARDVRNDQALRAAGWTVLRVWEHEPPREAASRVADLVARLRAERRSEVPSRPAVRPELERPSRRPEGAEHMTGSRGHRH